MLTNPDALTSMKKEWSGLIDQGVFDLDAAREYDAVAKEAKAKGEETHMARAHGIALKGTHSCLLATLRGSSKVGACCWGPGEESKL